MMAFHASVRPPYGFLPFQQHVYHPMPPSLHALTGLAGAPAAAQPHPAYFHPPWPPATSAARGSARTGSARAKDHPCIAVPASQAPVPLTPSGTNVRPPVHPSARQKPPREAGVRMRHQQQRTKGRGFLLSEGCCGGAFSREEEREREIVLEEENYEGKENEEEMIASVDDEPPLLSSQPPAAKYVAGRGRRAMIMARPRTPRADTPPPLPMVPMEQSRARDPSPPPYTHKRSIPRPPSTSIRRVETKSPPPNFPLAAFFSNQPVITPIEQREREERGEGKGEPATLPLCSSDLKEGSPSPASDESTGAGASDDGSSAGAGSPAASQPRAALATIPPFHPPLLAGTALAVSPTATFECGRQLSGGRGVFALWEGDFVGQGRRTPAVMNFITTDQTEKGAMFVEHLVDTLVGEAACLQAINMAIEEELVLPQYLYDPQIRPSAKRPGTTWMAPKLLGTASDLPQLRPVVESCLEVKKIPGAGVCMVMEKIGSGHTVWDFICQASPLNPALRADALYCAIMGVNILLAMLSLHRIGILHDDLHWSNVLIRSPATAQVAIIDYEAARDKSAVESGTARDVRTQPPAPCDTPFHLIGLLCNRSFPIHHYTDYVSVAWMVLLLAFSVKDVGRIVAAVQRQRDGLIEGCLAGDSDLNEGIVRGWYEAGVQAAIAKAQRAKSTFQQRAVELLELCCSEALKGDGMGEEAMMGRVHQYIQDTINDVRKKMK
ncbi:unnamed protein product [Vitrella brassicaformis CCMP3155]|uniref:Protein kinase domain-containing protein n=1 Tax=Vitrella brassicaformis (strain CCMP3155) TaxID=1169540 RepID=A0A0G4ES79_VITBC|nr:unnamed protein product [Vitrella brassicaformis CCMP3155]|eukprot:CEM00762.1 unnamed protein product [Vitrella brassicaformis CCMP3155]